MTFSEKILTWYRENKRSLPWRGTKDPYKIWLSEIMLQQTRVAQGTPYYLKFVETFPTVFDLAKAPEEQILKLWQGLGYYSRARNLHATAKMVVNDYNGNFPGTYKELLKLKGVGDYTASAIASISFDEPQAVVDGNVYRVLSRYFGVDLPINSPQGIKYFKELATEVMDRKRIRDYNQGIMEFGAIQCRPKNPYCLHCPLNDGCMALKEGRVATLPVKMNKTKVRNRYFNYIVPVYSNGAETATTFLKQRKGKGIWQGLWEFPLLESEGSIDKKYIASNYTEVLGVKKINGISLYNEKPVIHKLSHQHLHTHFWILESDEELEEGILVSKIEAFPVPVLIADFIKTFKF
ncbi:A/G-specific adenine glycosylase [Maribacter sp. 2210JD10-5]|uniref:A/G-specific adenine glycosylase n=1 Tax=Maribacter sp. 2210JD10-5 TaxID=3386272 RepID=UPI0039BC7A91